MFGRKRKRDEENVGLAGLGTGDAARAFALSGPANPSPTPMPPMPPTPTAHPALPETGSPPDAATSPATASPGPPNAGAAPAASNPLSNVPGLEPGAMPANPAAMFGQILSGQGPIGGLVAEIRKDPEAFRERMIAQARAQAQAQSKSQSQASGMATTTQWPANGGGTIHPHQADVIDELTKAADLHQQGALTDAEFAAIKKKLLDG